MAQAVAQASARGSAPVPVSDDERLHRLTRAAGSYLGLDVGDPLPVAEVVAQGEANGYDESEVRAMLDGAGYGSAESIPVPPQADAFGELWRVSGPTCAPAENTPASTCGPSCAATGESVGGEGGGTLDRFRAWLAERAASDKTHTYTRQAANRRFAKGKDVDRNFVRETDAFSTILITYARPRGANESIVEHAKHFYPRKVTRKRRRILKREGVYEGYAGVSVLAPKTEPAPTPREPGSSAPTTESEATTRPTTHAHDFLWVDGHVDPEAFAPLRRLDAVDVDVSVEHHTSAEVRTPDSVKARGSGMDSRRGATTALPQELGANLPLLTCRFDARGTPTYVEQWCAHLRAGADGSFSTQGVRRFRTLGSFKRRAEATRTRRKLRQAQANGVALARSIENRPRSSQNQESDSSESAPNSAESEGSRFTFRDHG